MATLTASGSSSGSFSASGALGFRLTGSASGSGSFSASGSLALAVIQQYTITAALIDKYTIDTEVIMPDYIFKGETVGVKATIRDEDGNLSDPDSLTFYIRLDDDVDTVQSYTVDATEFVHVSAGQYEVYVPITQSGRYLWWFSAVWAGPSYTRKVRGRFHVEVVDEFEPV